MNEQPEALRLADALDSRREPSATHYINEAADELRRLHAENEQLRSDLESIGAGGVGPLMPGKPSDCIPRKFNTWSPNEGDTWYEHPADAQIIEDVFGGDMPVVGDEYEVIGGWCGVKARYRITSVSEDGDCEVECVSHQSAAAAPKPPVNQQLREAAQQALQALQVLCDEYGRQMTAMNHKTPRRAKWTAALSAIATLSQAIEAEQQVSNPVESHQIEPVAVVDFTTEGWRKIVDALRTLPDGAQLYTRPQPAQEPLTDEAKAVIDAARAAMDHSTESYNGRGDISIASELAAALSLRIDEYDRAIERAHGIE